MAVCLDHWATEYVCSLCEKIPENVPLYHCPNKHNYCSKCYEELRRNYRGIVENGCTCQKCSVSSKFEITRVNADFLKKLKVNPGIGRPFRYASNSIASKSPRPFSEPPRPQTTHGKTMEDLFGLSTTDLHKFLAQNQNNRGDTMQTPHNYNVKSDKSVCNELGSIVGSTASSIRSFKPPLQKSSSIFGMAPSITSKKPILCPLDSCKRMIAVSSFAAHYKYDHPQIPRLAVERKKDLLVPCNVSLIEHGKSICLALVTSYEVNRINLLKSRSTYSVIQTCNKFCQRVPIGTFWIMITASKSRRKPTAFCLLWIFTNSEEKFNAVIEMSSTNDSRSVSVFCPVYGIRERVNMKELAAEANSLYLPYGTLAGLLSEGAKLNLRINIQ